MPFEAVVTSLSPNDSVAAITLENEAFTVSVLFYCLRRRNGTRICAIYCERSFPKLNASAETFFRRRSVLSSSPSRNLVDDSRHPRSLLVSLLLENN